MIPRNEMIPNLPSRRPTPLPLKIALGAVALGGVLVLAAGIWFMFALQNLSF